MIFSTKFWTTTLVILSFAGVAIFGFSSMNGCNGHDIGCLAAAIERAACPATNNPFTVLIFHLSAFKNFTAAVFGENILSFSLILAVLIYMAGLAAILRPRFAPHLAFSSPQYGQFKESDISPPKTRFMRWLALHENSPAFL